jgi:antitoxin CptB
MTSAVSDLERRRLRWRARRGLLENDLIITRFLDRFESELGLAEVRALDHLLELPDQELIELLLSRKELDAAADNVMRAVLAKIRSVQPNRA